jgi:biopolymer transport protein ExbB/TolQ
MAMLMAPLVVLPLLLLVLTFVAVLRWVDRGSSEREAFYQYEFRKKLLERGAQDASALREIFEAEERVLQRRRRERLKLTGIVAVAGGLAIVIAPLLGLDWTVVGLIAVFAGVGVLLYAWAFAPKA